MTSVFWSGCNFTSDATATSVMPVKLLQLLIFNSASVSASDCTATSGATSALSATSVVLIEPRLLLHYPIVHHPLHPKQSIYVQTTIKRAWHTPEVPMIVWSLIGLSTSSWYAASGRGMTSSLKEWDHVEPITHFFRLSNFHLTKMHS